MPIQLLSNFRHRFGPARDQGLRPTCLSFAASDAHASLRCPWNELSCEFLHYHAQRIATRSPCGGALLAPTLIALKDEGQPLERHWRYITQVPLDLTIYRPPPLAGVTPFFCDSGRVGTTLDDVIENLKQGNVSLMILTLSAAFDVPDVEGVVRAPAHESPDLTRRHAVVAVGHARIEGARALLIRNNWGEDWGLEGHAWLTEPFLSIRMKHVVVLTEIPHVHP
jgi:hypothetical protein